MLVGRLKPCRVEEHESGRTVRSVLAETLGSLVGCDENGEQTGARCREAQGRIFAERVEVEPCKKIEETMDTGTPRFRDVTTVSDHAFHV